MTAPRAFNGITPMSKIRVLRAITWLPVGGIERKLVDVLPRLDRDRFEVSLVCIRKRGPLASELEQQGIEVKTIPFGSRWDPIALRKLARHMRERKIDLVHSHMYRSNVPATVAARLAGVRHVWCQVHNVDTWETKRQASMDRFLCRWREGMLAVSEQVKRDVMANLRLPAERVRVIYNGVDTERFGKSAARERVRAEFGADDGDLVFLFAARLVAQKRPGDFLDLARYLLGRERADPARPKARFWIAGDGAMRSEIEEATRGSEFEGRVRMLGKRDDMADIMAGADAFVMTSTKEGFSNALVEAMASGLAVIATDVGGNAEAIRSGEAGLDAGLIIPPMNPQALREAADRVAVETEFRKTLQANARRRAQDFSLAEMIAKLETLYAESVSPG